MDQPATITSRVQGHADNGRNVQVAPTDPIFGQQCLRPLTVHPMQYHPDGHCE